MSAKGTTMKIIPSGSRPARPAPTWAQKHWTTPTDATEADEMRRRAEEKSKSWEVFRNKKNNPA